MAKDEVKARLAPIPVFTVANPKNEFVLVAGENNTQLGFFFFKRSDAEAIVEKAGVPVFQAEGLTVTTQEVSYVPLFLAKEDLDIAVQGAYKLRNAPQIKLLKDKASKLEEDYNQCNSGLYTA
ncbi:22 kDa translocon at the inner membrane of chloroplasts [Haematococcus lacustris]|uniref:22 kDa translocon at the inner membrane of chloroplasts n=1 Tax=Haematococcus lacustris TaxID=44745 RepID=A0A699ZRB0_HAELA|nr:22 kDa translocon at the inner membrane of chloroplasts [Haematococcus lacustris]